MGRQPEDCESTRPFSRQYAQAKVERFSSSGKVSIKPRESRIVAADVRRRDSIFCGDPPLHSGGNGGLRRIRRLAAKVWTLLQVSREDASWVRRGDRTHPIAWIDEE